MMTNYKIPKLPQLQPANPVKSNAPKEDISHVACQQKYNKLYAEHERTLGTWFTPEAVKALHQQIHCLTRCRNDLISIVESLTMTGIHIANIENRKVYIVKSHSWLQSCQSRQDLPHLSILSHIHHSGLLASVPFCLKTTQWIFLRN